MLSACSLFGCGPAVGTSGETGGGSDAQTSETQETSAEPTTDAPGSTGQGSGGTTAPVTTSGVMSTSTGSTSAGGDVDSSSGGGFVSTSGEPPTQLCSIWDQDCGPDETCRPWADDGSDVWNSARCSPVDPAPDSVGDPCTIESSPVSGVDSCEAGAFCMNVDAATLQGTCVQFCDGGPDSPQCPSPDQLCIQGNDGFVAACLQQCDPILQDCGEGRACVATWGTSDFFCAAPGIPYIDEAEVPVAACGVGRVAVPPGLLEGCDGSEPCCADICNLQDVRPQCDDDLVCETFFPEGRFFPTIFPGACISP